jgi:hypothetical protein
MLLNDPDEIIAQRASWSLGPVVADSGPDKIENFLRRLMWRVNPESGDNPLGVPEAIGEIGARAFEQVRPFVPVLLQYSDDEQLLPGILQAIGRIGHSSPATIEPHMDFLISTLTDERPSIFGNAALAMLRIDRRRAEEVLAKVEARDRTARIYYNGAYQMIRLREIAQLEDDRLNEFCFISRETEATPPPGGTVP